MRKIKPVTGSARLDGDILTITKIRQGLKDLVTRYRVEHIDSHPEIGYPAIRLVKLRSDDSDDDYVYDVLLTSSGPLCDCGDCTHRDRECKHIKALIAVRLLRR